jgi:hypothetical protein
MQCDRTHHHHQSENNPDKKPFADYCDGLNQKRFADLQHKTFRLQDPKYTRSTSRAKRKTRLG